MFRRMFKELTNWSKGELIFYPILIGLFTIAMSVVGSIFDFNKLYIVFSVLSIVVFMLVCKKTFIGYVLQIAVMVIYSLLAYKTGYYNDIVSCGLFILPYIVVEIIRWIQKKNNQPQIPSKKAILIESVLAILFIGMLFYGVYKSLYVLQNNWLIVSSISVCCAALFVYFSTYANKAISKLFLASFLALATVCWVFTAIYENLSNVSIAAGLFACFAMTFRMFILEIKKMFAKKETEAVLMDEQVKKSENFEKSIEEKTVEKNADEIKKEATKTSKKQRKK